MKCDLCNVEIEGESFALSNLSTPARILNVCERCAGSDWHCQDHAGVEVEVWRDDFIVADENRLTQAVEETLWRLEELGWTCEAMRLRAKSDKIKEPYE